MGYLNEKDNEVKKTEITEGLEGLKELLNKEKKNIVIFEACNIILSLFVVSILWQYILKIVGKIDSISVFNIFYTFSNIFTVLLSIGFIVVFSVAEYKTYISNQKDYIYDKERGYMIAKQGVYGTTHWMTSEEMKTVFSMLKVKMEKLNNGNIEAENWLDREDKPLENILGVTEKNELCCLNDSLVGINQNIMVFGAAGSGKSEAIAKPQIYQGILKGISMIVTDSKGDLYRETASLAKENGYIVRVLNFKPEELKNSDGIQFLKRITIDDDIMATTLANCIIENTGDGKMDYWATNEMNCLKALLLYVGTSKEHKKAGTNTLAEVFNMFNTYDAIGLKSLFDMLPSDHPAKSAFNIFNVCKDDVKAQILNGMSVRLSLLGNKYIRQIVSNDETDFTLPMQEKCIYYIVISDTDTSLKFLANLTFTVMFIEQCNYSDSLTKGEKKEQIPVKYILDEMANIGAIPYFDVKISTFRSRKISATMILQSISQLKNLYDKDRWKTIIANTTTKIMLKAGEEETAKFFSTLCDIQTVKVKNRKYEELVYSPFKIHPETSISEGYGKRELLTVGEALSFNNDYLLICILGYQPVKLKKCLAFRYHPMDSAWKEIHGFSSNTEMPPNRHIPQWYKDKFKNDNK